MSDQIEQPAMPRPRPHRPHHHRAEDDDEHDGEIRRQCQAEGVVETEALERVAAEEAANELLTPPANPSW